MLDQPDHQQEEPVLMDFHCIEALLTLPEFRVIDQRYAFKGGACIV
jgi:hypothetical protein